MPGKRAPNGEPIRLFEDAIKRVTDECIEWPYSRTKFGYGYIRIGKATFNTHRLSLIRTQGPPTTDKTHALHSCNNPKCFNPKHLRWGNNAGNATDRVNAGTQAKGERVSNSKLTSKQVEKIKIDHRLQKEIAADYGVHQSTIHRIKKGLRWAWIEGEKQWQ